MRLDFSLGVACAIAGAVACSAGGADTPASTPASASPMASVDPATGQSQSPSQSQSQSQQAPVQQPAATATQRPDASVTTTTPPPLHVMDAATPLDAGRKPAAPPDAGRVDARAPSTLPAAAVDASKPAVKGCKPAAKPTDMGVHFHHVGMLSMDPDADMQFYEKFFNAPATEYCRSEDGSKKTLATKTERGWFLYDRATQPPDDRLNSYLEHVGWLHPDPVAELQRLVEAGAPLYPEKRGQCASAAMGTAPCNNYWFYLRAPNGAEIEDALGPGPATMGFGHVHFVMGVDFDWFSKATDGAIKDQLIDQVNHTDVAVEEMNLANETVVDSRGKSIDHLGYSVADLDAHRARVMAAGLEIAEDISFKPEFGFRSFFLRSEKGIWIELVEDAAFTP